MLHEEILISTDFVELKYRNDLWREVTSLAFETSPILNKENNGLEGMLRSRPFGSLLLGSSAFNEQKYKRDRRIIMRSDFDLYFVQAFTSGSMAADFNGIDVSVTAGDICIQDLAQPFGSQVVSGSTLCVTIPRRELEKVTGSRNLHGALLKGTWPVTRLITNYLGHLVSIEDTLPTAQAIAAQEALITLLAGALTGKSLEHLGEYAPLGAALRQRVLTYIDQNLCSGDLTPEAIQRRFNVSRAHLYRAFSTDGGVAKIIQDRRLDTTFLELARAANPSRSIADIAYGIGFSSGNQLLRSFRARFGITPSEVRNEKWASHCEGPQTHGLQAYFKDIRERRLK